MTISPPTSSHNSPPSSGQATQLRDLFAGQVLAAMIIAPRQPGVSRLEMDDMAKMSYQYADAMLKAR